MGLLDTWNTRLGEAFQSPMFNAGIGILGANTGHYGAAMPAIGQGMNQGMARYNKNQIVQAQLLEQKRQEEAAKLEMARQIQKQKQLEQRNLYSQAMVNLNSQPGVPPVAMNNAIKAYTGTFDDPYAQLQAMKPKPVNDTSDIKNYEYYVQQEEAANRVPKSYNDWRITGKKAGATQVSIDNKPLKQSQAEAAGRVLRAEGASKEIERLAQEGNDRLNAWDYIVNTFTDNEAAKDWLVSDKGKEFSQGMDNWIENFGRTESGGVIGPNEYASWRSIYFPTPNSSQELIAQKARARKVVEAAFKISAGRGAKVAAQVAKELKAASPNTNKWIDGGDGYLYRLRPDGDYDQKAK